jgi:hypothetical protein
MTFALSGCVISGNWIACLHIFHKTAGSLARDVIAAFARLRLSVKKIGSCKRREEAICAALIKASASA